MAGAAQAARRRMHARADLFLCHLFVPLLLLPAAAAARLRLSFDFGWRHRTGVHSPADPNALPPLNPSVGLNPAEAQPNYDDSSWRDVQLPHDALIGAAASKAACPDGCSGRSFLPRHPLWYRKTFSLPSNWSMSSVWLDFEGSFRLSTVFLNGIRIAHQHYGYTPFRVRIDNSSAVVFGARNTIAVFVDPDNGDFGGRSKGSGWWYEGGGLYRHVWLVVTHRSLHFAQDGVVAASHVSAGSAARSAQLQLWAEVENGGDTDAFGCVTFTVASAVGKVVAAVAAQPLRVAPGGFATASATCSIASPLLWSLASPALYTVTATLRDGSCDASAVDVVAVPHGVRSLRFDADHGFFLNEAHFKMRGFCDHNTFAVVGMAVPERVALFRAQALRAVGGNARRTSHNPPETAMLDIYDRLGVVVIDENRLFRNRSVYVTNMATLVKRDRNHPSVVIWSFCNEAMCMGTHQEGGPAFQRVSEFLDGTRPTLANMFTFGDLLSTTIDVQGFSHRQRHTFDHCHKRLPLKPILHSECCSCNTMRDEDEGCETLSDNPHSMCVQKAFNARCAEAATNASDGVAYAVGTMVWTLFDYYGEPPSGKIEVSSTYGQFDLCGFPKAAALWYRMQWLLGVADGTDKPFPTRDAHEVHLVESWESPVAFNSTRGERTRTVHVYSSAPRVQLFVNGKSQGSRSVRRMVEGSGSYAEFLAVPWQPGRLSAVARDGSGAAVANASRYTSGPAAALALSLDAPSVVTGTGVELLLDGQDVALLRAAVVDAAGRVVHLADNTVTFTIVSGPGAVQGTHNGDAHSQLRNDAATYPAYHGLVRAVVRVTSVAGRPAAERAMLAQIDTHGPMAADAAPTAPAVAPIVVQATSPGLGAERISIPVSSDERAASVLTVAAKTAGRPVDFFGHLREA